MSTYVLIDELETKKRGKPVYFAFWTGIGPAYTEHLEDAERFASKELAFQSPAYSFSFTFFEPQEVNYETA